MVPSRYFPNRCQEWNFYFSNAYSVDIQKRSKCIFKQTSVIESLFLLNPYGVFLTVGGTPFYPSKRCKILIKKKLQIYKKII